MLNRLFAYGTLRKGSAPPEIAEVVELFEPLGSGVAQGKSVGTGLFPGAVFYPGGVFKNHASKIEEIFGEVYEVPSQELWPAIDAYEEYQPDNPAASIYIRREIEVQMAETGERIQSWVYEYNVHEHSEGHKRDA